MIDRLIYLEEEVIRLARELAEAKARAVIPDGWVAVPENYTAEMRDAWDGAPVSEDLDIDFDRAYRAMIAARPEYPPSGLPKESGNG